MQLSGIGGREKVEFLALCVNFAKKSALIIFRRLFFSFDLAGLGAATFQSFVSYFYRKYVPKLPMHVLCIVIFKI